MINIWIEITSFLATATLFLFLIYVILKVFAKFIDILRLLGLIK